MKGQTVRSPSTGLVLDRFRNEFDIVDAKINSLHGARSHAEANRHLSFFFPEERLLVVLKPNLTDQQRCTSLLVPPFSSISFFHRFKRKFIKRFEKRISSFWNTKWKNSLQNKRRILLMRITAEITTMRWSITWPGRSTDRFEECRRPMRPFDLVVLRIYWSWRRKTLVSIGTIWLDLKIQLKRHRKHRQGKSFRPSLQSIEMRTSSSLRALYGKDLVHNAIEVSSDAAKAKDDIHIVFGDLDGQSISKCWFSSMDWRCSTFWPIICSAPIVSRVRRSMQSSASLSPDMFEEGDSILHCQSSS